MSEKVFGLDEEIKFDGRATSIRREIEAGNQFFFRSIDGATLEQGGSQCYIVIEGQTFLISGKDHSLLTGGPAGD